jgi:hypothetical protein
MPLWDILLLKFLWDGHKAHEAWLNKPPSSRLGALIKIPFLLLEGLFRLVILGPFLLIGLCLMWCLVAPTSFQAFTHWLGPVKTQETVSTAISPDIDTPASSSTSGQNSNPTSATPNIDQLEQMYGAETQFDYVSNIWGTQLPHLKASDARRIVTDRELRDDDYVVTLPRDETAGHSVLVDRHGSPILVIHREADFVPLRPESPTASEPQSGTSTQEFDNDLATFIGGSSGTYQGCLQQIEDRIDPEIDKVQRLIGIAGGTSAGVREQFANMLAYWQQTKARTAAMCSQHFVPIAAQRAGESNIATPMSVFIDFETASEAEKVAIEKYVADGIESRGIHQISSDPSFEDHVYVWIVTKPEGNSDSSSRTLAVELSINDGVSVNNMLIRFRKSSDTVVSAGTMEQDINATLDKLMDEAKQEFDSPTYKRGWHPISTGHGAG